MGNYIIYINYTNPIFAILAGGWSDSTPKVAMRTASALPSELITFWQAGNSARARGLLAFFLAPIRPSVSFHFWGYT